MTERDEIEGQRKSQLEKSKYSELNSSSQTQYINQGAFYILSCNKSNLKFSLHKCVPEALF